MSIARAGNKVSELTPLGFGIMSPPTFLNPRLSPDGTRILILDVDKEEKLGKGMVRFPRLYVYDLKARTGEKLADLALDAFVREYAWSPDSKHVAYVWKRMEPGVPLTNSLGKDGKPKVGKVVETETHLDVADPDGKNAETIYSAKGRTGPAITLMRLDWRCQASRRRRRFETPRCATPGASHRRGIALSISPASGELVRASPAGRFAPPRPSVWRGPAGPGCDRPRRACIILTPARRGVRANRW